MALTAEVIRGRRKGETITIFQWCDGWIVDGDDKIWSPRNLECGESAIRAILKADAEGRNGTMFTLYERLYFQATGRFRRR